jgi:hypothetical protein
MLANQDGYGYAELLAPNAGWWSEEWSLPATSDGWTQIVSRWNGDEINVQGQNGTLQQAQLPSNYWSPEWHLLPQPSGLCSPEMTATTLFPPGATACLCGASGCPAFLP